MRPKDLTFRILHGNECDILKDGAMDYPDEVLAELDYVVASVHSHFGMSEAEATERLITAVSNPYVDILGHPTGRLLLRREGYPIDTLAVLDACAEHQCRRGTERQPVAARPGLDVCARGDRARRARRHQPRRPRHRPASLRKMGRGCRAERRVDGGTVPQC